MRSALLRTACVLYFLTSCETATTGDACDDGIALKRTQSHDSIAILANAKTTWRKVVCRKVTVEGIAWADGKGTIANPVWKYVDEATQPFIAVNDVE